MTVQNWYRHNEAADYCRISPRTLRRWRDAGRIRAYGGKYFRDDLDRAVRNGDVFPAEGSATGVFVPRDVVRGGQIKSMDGVRITVEQAPGWYPIADGGWSYWDGQTWIADFHPDKAPDGSYSGDRPTFVPTRA